jgi:NADH-quinone oxidoreductase subunit A
MNSPNLIVGYLALFVSVGLLFVFINLLVGYLVRPKAPNTEKLEVYECGEPTIGSSFVQFDLRFYVVALLFIIFDVEVAFFFPWATVYGKAIHLLDPNLAVATASQSAPNLTGPTDAVAVDADSLPANQVGLYRELGVPESSFPTSTGEIQKTADTLALTSIIDIGVFFAVLLVGFAYVWQRGDLDWVRALSRERGAVATPSEARLVNQPEPAALETTRT